MYSKKVPRDRSKLIERIGDNFLRHIAALKLVVLAGSVSWFIFTNYLRIDLAFAIVDDFFCLSSRVVR